MSVKARTSTTITSKEREPLGEGETFSTCSMDLRAEYQNGKYEIVEGTATRYISSDTLEISIPAVSYELEQSDNTTAKGNYYAGIDKGE